VASGFGLPKTKSNGKHAFSQESAEKEFSGRRSYSTYRPSVKDTFPGRRSFNHQHGEVCISRYHRFTHRCGGRERDDFVSVIVLSLATFTMYRITFRSDVKKHLSVPFRNAIFIGIIATERGCFAQLLKVVHSVSDR
jgi:hypothetical protein